MCLIGIAYQAHPRYELVLAANRDEFHARPAAPAAYWADTPDIYGGRDLSQGGGWLVVSRQRRLAAVTNVRRMVPPSPSAPSRGALVAGFTGGAMTAADYAQQLSATATRYAGFNLLLWDGTALLYVSNQPQFQITPLTPGVHGVSNAQLDTPWPKLRKLKRGISLWLAQGIDEDEGLFSLLSDDQPASDTELPDTGVGLNMERFLSSAFIRGDGYGTRASSVLCVSAEAARFNERRYGPEGFYLGQSSESVRFAFS